MAEQDTRRRHDRPGAIETIGLLRQRVSIQSPGKSTSGPAGGIIPGAYATSGPFWAKVEPLTGREMVNARAVYAEVTYRVTLRYRRGLLPTARLIYPAFEPGDPVLSDPRAIVATGRKILAIAAIIDLDEKHEYLRILSSETVPSGG